MYLFARWRVLSNDERRDLAAQVTERDAPTVAWLLGLRGDFAWFVSHTGADPQVRGALASHAAAAYQGWAEAQDLMRRIAVLVRAIETPGPEAIANLKDDPIAQLRLWLASLRRRQAFDDATPFGSDQITGLQRTWRVVVDRSLGGTRDLGLDDAAKAVAELLDRLACRGRGGARPSPLRLGLVEWEC